MDITERQKALKDYYLEQLGAITSYKFSELYGVSNSAQILENGIQAGNVNLNSVSADPGHFLFSCVFRLPPEDEVYFCIHVDSQSNQLVLVLDEMKKRAGEEIASENYKFNDNNKNVKLGITHGGKLFLKNVSQWETLDVNFSSLMGETAKGVDIDSITVAIYPPEPTARRSLAVSEFIGYLGKLVGATKVHEVDPWQDETTVSPLMQRSPPSIPIAEIRSNIEHQGGHYPNDLIERFHASLNYMDTKHFVILGGISGSGKTNLAIQYARAVHGITDAATHDPFLFVCPIRPDWTDPTGLLGYHDVLTNRFLVPIFLEAVLVALSNPRSPVFVCLDEMNLARVEYYFADVLSAIETGQPLKIHSNDIPIEASTGGDVVANLPMPSNLYIVGTINIDETTNTISDKVLDRSMYIDMSSIDLEAYCLKLKADIQILSDSIDSCGELLREINSILEPHQQHFGYRLAKECIEFHHYSTKQLARPSTEVIDELLIQKVLVKLRGSEYQRQMLGALEALLTGYPLASDVLGKLKKDLDELGSFQNSR